MPELEQFADSSGDPAPKEAAEVLEQQNIRLPMSIKSHLSRLAAQEGMSLPRFIVEVICADYVDASRERLKSMYMADAARAQAEIEKLDEPKSSTLGRGRKRKA